mmetsp:Transcript_4513/g.11349  ORF Transcript_4513/g.11349 Transcript_4513/m.11349 type:complete len:85 (-) Transcript_4513:7-261(-)
MDAMPASTDKGPIVAFCGIPLLNWASRPLLKASGGLLNRKSIGSDSDRSGCPGQLVPSKKSVKAGNQHTATLPYGGILSLHPNL